MHDKQQRDMTPGQLTLADALNELTRDEQEVLRRQWGLGRRVTSDDDTADDLQLDLSEVWKLQDRALQTLGYLWLTETLLPAFKSVAEAA